VGLGKIARDQHLPTILQSEDFEIAFLVDKTVQTALDAPHFRSLEDALQSGIGFDAVSLCTSPQPRLQLFEHLLVHACSILLEKPPAGTFAQAAQIGEQVGRSRANIFTAWHSRFAPEVDTARTWMATRELSSGRIEWRENAEKWHPGQDWLWREGGFGVFDPGMNAVSILTELLPGEVLSVGAGQLAIPENSDTPTVAGFQLLARGAPIDIEFEFHDRDEETWTIELRATDGSSMLLSQGGAAISIDCGPVTHSVSNEYASIYERFAKLVRSGQSDFDAEPLRIIDQVFAKAARKQIAPLPNRFFQSRAL